MRLILENDNGTWCHQWVIVRPHRIRLHSLLRGIERGLDHHVGLRPCFRCDVHYDRIVLNDKAHCPYCAEITDAHAKASPQ